MHQRSFTQHKHSYMHAKLRKGHLRFRPNLLHANQIQARPNLLHTRCWDPYFCKKEESCKFLFAHILSNDALHAYRIPSASFESWDFGPKIGLDGLHGLAEVWTPLPPYHDPVDTMDRFIGQPKFAGKTYTSCFRKSSSQKCTVTHCSIYSMLTNRSLACTEIHIQFTVTVCENGNCLNYPA